MSSWQALTLLSLDSVFVVPSEKGKNCIITDRPTYGLSFSYGGKITYVLNGRKTVSHSLSAVFLPKGRTYRLLREESGDFPVINFTAYEAFTDEFIQIPLQHSEIYLSKFEALRAAWQNQSNPAKAMSLFYEILSLLSEEQEQSNPHDSLSRSMEYLNTHLFDSALSNQRLADEGNISEVYFRKLFRQAYGIPPHRYILQARIHHAKQLLGEQSASVTAIAEACGFSCVYHFCRSFKQMTGMTPTEYIKKK